MAQWDSNPFANIGTGSKSNFSFSPHATRSKAAPPMTAQQILALQLALNHPKSGSFLDEIKHAGGAALHPVGWAFDKLLRPNYAIASGLDKEITSARHGGSFLHNLEAFGSGAKAGFTGHNKEGFGQVLKHQGVLAHHATLRGVAGLGLDVVGDPLTYVTGGASNVVLRSAEHAGLVHAGDIALHGADNVSELKKAAFTLSKGGKDYSYRHALAKERVAHLTTPAGQEAGALDRLHIAQAAANAEKRRVEKFLPQYKIGARGKGLPITPTHILGKRVVPALPKLDNFIAQAPIGGGLAESFRNKFIREAGVTPEAHAARMTTQHIAEQHAAENLRIVRDALHNVKLSEDKALKALHYGETIKNFVLKTKNGFRLNEGAISKLMREGKIDAHQVRFLRRWFAATQLLYAKDHALGVLYAHTGERGQLYVPHLVDKLGRPLSDLQKNALSKATHQYARGESRLSTLQLAEKAKAGELGRGVETNPYRLLAATARSRAMKQADTSLATEFARQLSIPTRIVDTAKLAKKQAALDSLGIDHSIHAEGHLDAMAQAHNAEQTFLANHEAAYQQRLDELSKLLRSHKYRNNHRLKAANVARIQKQILKLHENHVKELEQIAKGRHPGLNEAIAPHIERAAQHRAAIKEINKQQKGLEGEIKTLMKGKKSKAYSEAKHVTVPGLVDKNGHPLAFEPDVGNAILKYKKIASGEDQAIEDFSKGWRSFIAKWKLAVTSVNPGYRLRNSMSDVWAMYLSGVPMHAIPRYAAKAVRLAHAAKRMDTPEGLAAYKQMVEAYHHGILSGLYQGDVQKVADYIKYGNSKKALLRKGHVLQAGTKMMQDFNAHVENLGRITHYLYRREALHESAAQAAFKVKAAHFDYEDLTPFEQKRMKSIAPFYTWSRKNIPFQIKALVSAPGKYAAFPKTILESEQAAGGDKGNIIPSFVPQSFGFQVPFGKHNYLLPPIGAQDLQVFDSKSGAAQRAEQLINPAISFPFELFTNKNIFTGGQIASDTHRRNPVSNLGADLLKLLPGSDVGQTARTVNGKRVTGPGANPYYQFALGQIPLLRQLGLNYSGINKQKAGQNALSYLGGLSVQNINPAEQKMIASIQLQNELKKEVTSLRDAGLWPLAKSKKSKKQNLIDQILFQKVGK